MTCYGLMNTRPAMERGQETTYEYDKLGRITSTTDEL